MDTYSTADKQAVRSNRQLYLFSTGAVQYLTFTAVLMTVPTYTCNGDGLASP